MQNVYLLSASEWCKWVGSKLRTPDIAGVESELRKKRIRSARQCMEYSLVVDRCISVSFSIPRLRLNLRISEATR
ncbi:MAG: hypothetical protein WCG42_06975 [Parachlamydiaceae bacterium]